MTNLDHLTALLAAATPGKWRVGTNHTWSVFVPYANAIDGPHGERVLLQMNKHFDYAADAALIVALRNAAPELIAELRAARTELAEAEGYEADRSEAEAVLGDELERLGVLAPDAWQDMSGYQQSERLREWSDALRSKLAAAEERLELAEAVIEAAKS